MNVHEAFGSYQGYVDAAPESVKEANSRAATFREALMTMPDVVEVFTSGSLRRKTHKDPIHDVDVVIVFDAELHPAWGTPGTSASDALTYTGQTINQILGQTNGSVDQLVRRADPRNHAVKCFIDDPEDPNAFTVDAMPAFRTETGLLVPEARSRKWVATNPEYLIEEVARRRAEWTKYQGTVRMLKDWASIQTGVKVKSLVMEVLSLIHMPLGGGQPAALKEFFVRAASFIEDGYAVTDPAGLCGAIQGDLDYAEFGRRLRVAADGAAAACSYAALGENALAIRKWCDVFGDGFPLPPKTAIIPAAAAAVVAPRPVKDSPQG